MRLSFIFELLLIFVFLAFAASRVIDSKGLHNVRTKSLTQKHKSKTGHHKVRQQDAINRYCSCSNNICNCCREFNIPAVSLKGPGCASLQYLSGDKLAISMSFGERVLTNTTINSRHPRPICMPLPGGVSKFCGRVYNIARKGQDFNACLGLELKALKNVEAALRVSCFRFGQDGLRVEPSQPLPPVQSSTVEEDDDDDDEDDYDDEDDFGFDDDDDDDDDDDEEDDDNDVESTDYESFSLLDDDFIDGLFTSEGDDGESTPVKKVSTTTRAPLRRVTKKPLRKVTHKPTNIKKVTRRPPSTTTKPVKKVQTTKSTTASPIVPVVTPTTVVEHQKKPELIIPITNISINEIPDSTLVEVPIPDHDSVIVVTSSSDVPPLQADTSDTNFVNHATLPEPVNVIGGLITKVEVNEETPSTVDDVSLEQATTSSFYETTVQQVTNANTLIMQDADTEIDEKVATTEAAIAADEDEEENEETVQSFIVKNDDDDDAEEEEDDEDSDESDPLTDVVEDVLGVEDEKENKKKNDSKLEDNIKDGDDKNKEASSESKDVVDDIIDGTVDMISITDDSDEDKVATKGQSKKEESDEDDILDDDDDDDDDSDEDDDDDDDSEDEEDEARKSKSNSRKKTRADKRKSRDMWLDRLHW